MVTTVRNFDYLDLDDETSASVSMRLWRSRPLGEEIVSGAEHRNEQQDEVGVHRGPQGRRWLQSTADFDPAAYDSFDPTPAPPAVEQPI
jgi:hypothetical protein